MIPKPTPAERREERRQRAISDRRQDLEAQLNRIRQGADAYVKTIAAGNAGGVVVTLNYIANNEPGFMSLLVLNFFLWGTCAGLVLLNCSGISRITAAKKAAELMNSRITGAPDHAAVKANVFDLREAFDQQIKDMKDMSSPIDRFAAHGFLIGAAVSVVGLACGTLIGFLALYLSWIFN